ncbi:hypothetical protein B296_00004054 [Ensete ventricosum]|uniref:Pectin acetylesterase n=1 Tax=Ensete ventricosum TaxID=4639 RepID=A0A427A774_ENSVE|nr:hypothetical protein B296_00004054 [Ensete ventricosum]
MMSALWVVVMMIGVTPWGSTHCLEVKQEKRLLVAMTLVPDAVCLDGSPPAYHLHGGLGSGARNWLLQFEVELEVFSGILSNDSTTNPGLQPFPSSLPSSKHAAAVVSDITFRSSDRNLFFSSSFGRLLRLEPSEASLLRWRLLWWRLGVPQQRCSAGGLATFLHCDDLTRFVPETATVKCISDAGFFLDV